jgi:hypothetical protein
MRPEGIPSSSRITVGAVLQSTFPPFTAIPADDVPARREVAAFGGVGLGERRALLVCAAILAGLRVLTLFKLNFNSDEPQHLHVVWAWANGLLPYRDVFDNHTPLFHLLFAPLFRLCGETARILIYMRLAMLPLFAATLGGVFLIGARLFSWRVGAWAAIFAGACPWFFYPAVQFRTDNLWAVGWVATIACLLASGPWTVRRCFVAGLLAGATLAVSMKTTLLLGALALAALVTLGCLRAAGRRVRAAEATRGVAALLAGFLVVPAALIAFFAARGALGPMSYCIILHNRVPGMNTGRIFFVRQAFWLSLPFLNWAAFRFVRDEENPDRGVRRALLLLSTGFYCSLLLSFWPLLTRQDFLPFIPLAALVFVPPLLALCDRAAAVMRLPSWTLLALCAAGELLFLCQEGLPWRDHTSTTIRALDAILRVSRPDDYVMDAKSGAIYRRRPYYYVIESLTRGRLALGWIKDDIVERLIATRTCLASEDRLSGSTLKFVLENYLPFVRKMRVAGQQLTPDPQTGSFRFKVRIPARYNLVVPGGAAAGSIDGAPYSGALFLDAGPHEFVAARHTPLLALYWAPAVEAGFSPFTAPHP